MYPQAFVEYLVHFHCDRDYFECHEVLEEYWKETDSKQNKYWVGLIQLAVSLYHHRRENFRGAEKLMGKAILNLQNEQSNIEDLGINYLSLIKLMKERLLSIQNQQVYLSINLPIVDPQLFNICQEKCNESKLIWGKESNLNDNFLIHKHKLRNRQSIIEARKQKMLSKP